MILQSLIFPSGGLAAVIYTDALQAAILIIGAVTVTGLGITNCLVSFYNGVFIVFQKVLKY